MLIVILTKPLDETSIYAKVLKKLQGLPCASSVILFIYELVGLNQWLELNSIKLQLAVPMKSTKRKRTQVNNLRVTLWLISG